MLIKVVKTLEPARFGAKIFHGPDIRNFKEVYQYLNSLKLLRITTPLQCAKFITFQKNMINEKNETLEKNFKNRK